jgi:hypothetical protein
MFGGLGAGLRICADRTGAKFAEVDFGFSGLGRGSVLHLNSLYESVRILACRRRLEQNRTNIDFFAVLEPANHCRDEASDILHGR